ncbi:MAG: hypothetical protein ACP5N1_05535 [Candidatus Woesearchaeota archaeon]
MKIFDLILPRKNKNLIKGSKLNPENATANEYAEKSKKDIVKAIALSEAVHFTKPETIKEFISYIRKSSLENNLSKIYYGTEKKRALDYESEIKMLTSFLSMIDRLDKEYSEEIVVLDQESKKAIHTLSRDIVAELDDDVNMLVEKKVKSDDLLNLRYRLGSLRNFFIDLSNFELINYYSISAILEYLARENFYSNKMRTNYMNFRFYYNDASVNGRGRVEIEDYVKNNKLDIDLQKYNSLHHDATFNDRSYLNSQLSSIRSQVKSYIEFLEANNSAGAHYTEFSLRQEVAFRKEIIGKYAFNMPAFVKFSSYAQSRKFAVIKYLGLLHESIVKNKYPKANILTIEKNMNAK